MYRKIAFIARSAGSNVPVILGLFSDSKEVPAGYRALDASAGGVIAQALERPDFSLSKGKVNCLYPTVAGQAPKRIWIVGLGDRTGFTLDALRLGAAKLVAALFAARIQKASVSLSSLIADPDAPLQSAQELGRAFADGITLANFEFNAFKGAGGKPADEKAQPIDLALEIDEVLLESAGHGSTINQGVNIARELAATPPNVANPKFLVDFARAMAEKTGLKFSAIDQKQATKLGMGGLVAVGAAGSTPPALIVLEHKPKGARNAKTGPILLVGKAVTFDTGGYSIKPAENMDKMKYDKCGGMAVLGAMHAIASLNLPVHVVGLVPTAENMINENAYRPGDIVTFCNGVTAEITNTDAEGRLILADALAYGTKTYKPVGVVDLATLTGGVVVALGTHAAGIFCSDASFRGKLFDAADFTGERLWHLPLWNEHREQIKGTHGDIVNSAGRDAHPIQGAAFLSYFIGPDGPTRLPTLPWAHLDIAGVSDVKKETGIFATGPTGFGVRLLVRLVETWQ